MSEEILRAELIAALTKLMTVLELGRSSISAIMKALQEEADRLRALIVRLKEGEEPIQ
jgi:hypothetical protein